MPWNRRRFVVVGVAVAIVVAVFLFLALVPVPHQFSMQGVAIYDLQTTCPGIYVTQGTSLSFHWSAPSFVWFAVVDCSENQVAYMTNGTSGSGSFVSTGSVYEFGALCPGSVPCVPADVSGSFTGPLLQLWSFRTLGTNVNLLL